MTEDVERARGLAREICASLVMRFGLRELMQSEAVDLVEQIVADAIKPLDFGLP